MIVNAKEIIELYQLQPHPEGGYFREIYRSEGIIPQAALTGEWSGNRNYCTAIYFLLESGQKSCLHRIKSDEIWHFYLGGAMTLWQMHPDYGVEKIILGSNIREGEKLQHIVPAGWWFGGYPSEGIEFSLLGCTVAPGFDFADFEMGEREQLLELFPERRDIISKLTG